MEFQEQLLLKAINDFAIDVLNREETKNNPEMVTAIARLLGAKF
ncbi:hypothetical protein [Weissella tructae]